MIDGRYLERAGNVVLENNTDLPAFQAWAQAGTQAGCQLWMQISHPGRQCLRLVNMHPIAPSAQQLNMSGLAGKPRAMDDADIEDVIKRFAATATLAKQAGFSGVQIHSAHGYLLSQFLSPLSNRRQDTWGGSLENRARLLIEVVRAVRTAVGATFPIGVKLNSADFQKGGYDLDDCVRIAGWLGDEGIDLLEISGGSYERFSFLGAEDLEVRDSTRQREAYFLEYADAISTAAKVPLVITGGFRTRSVMNEALASGKTDMIGIARPFCTDPHVAAKLLAGSLEKAPVFENGLKLGNGWFGLNSSNSLIKGMNALAHTAWYYRQLILLSEDRPVTPNLSAIGALLRHSNNDFLLNIRRKLAS